MRELKFRAWACGRMEYFDFYLADCYAMNENVMQFTGLQDKNGKDIYEGDIVRRYGGGIGTVVWYEQDACFGVDYIQSWLNLPMTRNWLVIGNIHESPELLDCSDVTTNEHS